ncbi:MAG: long-chain acyl-CoA synthetase [Saprospiraceae bacterium]|jgi:long-chain acyl-CoA synthetase
MSEIVKIFERLELKNIQNKTFAQLEKSYSYADLIENATRLGGVFEANKLVEGDRIIISTKNHYALACITLSGLRFGITVIPVDPDIGPIRANDLINLCAPKGLFIDQSLVAKWNFKKQEFFIFPLIHHTKKKGTLFKKLLSSKTKNQDSSAFPEVLQQYSKVSGPATIASSTIAYILFTSGTTSTSKAVQISHHALWTNLETVCNVYDLDQNSRIFNILTMYHTDGVIQGPVMAAFKGVTWYHPMDFTVDLIPRVFDAMYKYQITHFITVPTMLAFLQRFSEGYEDSFAGEDFKYVVTSAAPFELKLWQAFEHTFNTKVINVYGLTETIAGASYCGPDKPTRKVGTIGKPIDCEFKIVDNEGNELGDNAVGELLIKGDNVLSNYLNDEKATNEAFKDGWFVTGDLAKRDESGFYSLAGRKKNLVISGGVNIQPEQISEIINTHADVLESVSFGMKDEIFGERLISCVVLSPNAQFDELKLVEHCRTQLEPAKIPKEIHQVLNIPKTASGKIQLENISQLLQASDFEKPGQDIEISEGVLSAAADAFKVSKDTLTLDASADRLEGWDSMAHLVFVTNLEAKFNIRFSSKEIMVIYSLREAEKLVSEKT